MSYLDARSVADAENVGERRTPDCVSRRDGRHGAPVWKGKGNSYMAQVGFHGTSK